jgi:uncharacterized BrkB/YihY/UPF0761 family membrane protein
MMNLKLLKILNPILFIAFLTVAISMLLYRLPGRFNYDEIVGQIHALSGAIFFILAILHIILNFKWIKSQIFGIKAKK